MSSVNAPVEYCNLGMKLGDKQHQISGGDNFLKLFIQTSIDSILMISHLRFGVWGWVLRACGLEFGWLIQLNVLQRSQLTEENEHQETFVFTPQYNFTYT